MLLSLSFYFLVSQLLQHWGEEDFLAYVDRYCILGSILYIEMDVTQLFYFELFQNDVKNTRYKVYYLTNQTNMLYSLIKFQHFHQDTK